jgi:hypothetical protein
MTRWTWAAVLCGPVLWMVHISGVSAFASGACGHHAYTWLAHALTLATGLPLLVGIAVSARLGQAASSATVKFLGWFGVGVGGVSLLLIGLEEAYIWTVRVCR